jgi:hypothetical protein
MRIVSFWLTLWMSREFLGATSLGVRLLGLLNLVPVYLLAGSIFPENPTGRADLREYYHDNARFTWSLFSFNLGYFATYGIFVQVAGGASWQVMLQFLAWFWIPVPFTIALAVWPRWRLLHWIVLVPLTLWAVVPIVATRL